MKHTTIFALIADSSATLLLFKSRTAGPLGADRIHFCMYICRCHTINHHVTNVQSYGDGKWGIGWSFVGCPGAGRRLDEGGVNDTAGNASHSALIPKGQLQLIRCTALLLICRNACHSIMNFYDAHGRCSSKKGIEKLIVGRVTKKVNTWSIAISYFIQDLNCKLLKDSVYENMLYMRISTTKA